METLVVYAHPKTPGHNATILGNVKKKLEALDKDYEVLDLYEMKYDPVLHEKEHYTAGNRNVSDQNKKIQNKIKDATHLIFIYPLWWDSMPAILKGFFDRVFVSGFSFNFGPHGIPIQHLKGKRAVTFVTQGGPALYYNCILKNRGPKIVAKDTLAFCGIKTKFYTISQAAKALDEKKKKTIRKKVRKGIAWLYR
ncbi:MAG: NAD(P)H-dependent oxidoreductase [Nanoarchaeota archaeon]